MSYTKNTWTNGDTITAEKLNNMENGIANAGGTLIIGVTVTGEGQVATMDKTWQEIHDALATGLRVIVIESDPVNSEVTQETIHSVYLDNEYYVSTDMVDFSTGSPSGYPSYMSNPPA